MYIVYVVPVQEKNSNIFSAPDYKRDGKSTGFLGCKRINRKPQGWDTTRFV